MGSVLKRTAVEYSSTRSNGASRAAGESCAPKRAELVMVEGRPTAIEFTCSCGERSLIELEFDPSAGADAERKKSK